MTESDHLVWIDLEMTGLSPSVNVILEIATIVTDAALNIVAEGPNIAIFQPQGALNKMDEWNTQHHSDSGLIKRVQNSGYDVVRAEQETLDFLHQHVMPGTSPMCGNSVHMDRQFLARYMPKLAAFFHYRNCDVSTVKELAKRWSPELYESFQKESVHLALEDIKESIDELRFYKQHFFNIGKKYDQ